MDRPAAVIFDMDGVLVLSGPAHWDAWRDTAAAHGRPISHAEFLGFNGMTNQDICTRLWGSRATPEFIATIADRKERAYRDAVRAQVPLAPGCHDLLSALHAHGVQMAVGSSGPQENVELVLEAGGIRPFFGAVVHAGLVQRGKPAPDIFLAAADLLRVPPARCVVLEDAPNGIQAALAAGMRVLGLATNHVAAELHEHGAELVLPDLASVTWDDVQRA
jgi:beta-phosphoglucomutase